MHVGKTLKMLGEVYGKEGENGAAEQCLRRAQKVLQEQGNHKLVKEVKSKITQLKESREQKINHMI